MFHYIAPEDIIAAQLPNSDDDDPLNGAKYQLDPVDDMEPFDNIIDPGNISDSDSDSDLPSSDEEEEVVPPPKATRSKKKTKAKAPPKKAATVKRKRGATSDTEGQAKPKKSPRIDTGKAALSPYEQECEARIKEDQGLMESMGLIDATKGLFAKGKENMAPSEPRPKPKPCKSTPPVSARALCSQANTTSSPADATSTATPSNPLSPPADTVPPVPNPLSTDIVPLAFEPPPMEVVAQENSLMLPPNTPLPSTSTPASTTPEAQSDATTTDLSLMVAGSWLVKPLGQLTAMSLTPTFDRLLGLLVTLEHTYGLVNKTRGFPKVEYDRPLLLTTWVRDGRGRTCFPAITNVPKFADGWWLWWSYLQPGWRSRKRPLSRDSSFNDDENVWSKLIAPGANGMLGVVVCVYWWGKAELNKEIAGAVKVQGRVEDWEEAVTDVEWVLKELIDWTEIEPETE